jgi:hypothetical protein
MGIRRLFAASVAGAILSGCATNGAITADASTAEAAAAAYRHDGPPALTLYTMINNRSGAGAHTSLMVNAPSQRVIFDPAGSVELSVMPEIGDVLYGITPRVQDWYERAHARETYHVRIQRIEVPPTVAERALRLVQESGPVASTRCTSATASILRQLPGFESLSTTWFPNTLADQVARLSGVDDRKLFEEDPDDKGLAEARFETRLADQPAQ